MKLYEKIKELLHLKLKVKPEIDLNTQIYLQLRPFILPLILTVLLMMTGTLGYIIIDDFELMPTIYQTGITFTTIGFEKFGKISEIEEIFTISLIIFGFFSMGVIIEVINKGELFSLLTERHMLYNIARLKKHFVNGKTLSDIEKLKKLSETKIRRATGVTIVGIKEENGKFIPMPKSNILIKDHSSLFLFGTEAGIKSAKKTNKKKINQRS